jgi:hypothetical protein
METTESIEGLNKQLADLFGIDTISSRPIWRIVWAEEQREKRLTKFSPSGIEFIYPEPMELPKYPHIKGRYILEKLVIVPEMNRAELCDALTSYECMWVFENEKVGYLPPRLDVAQLVIHTLNFAQHGNRSGLRKYVENIDEEKRKDFQRIWNDLFGNETDVTDALRYKEAVTVPFKQFGDN